MGNARSKRTRAAGDPAGDAVLAEDPWSRATFPDAEPERRRRGSGVGAQASAQVLQQRGQVGVGAVIGFGEGQGQGQDGGEGEGTAAAPEGGPVQMLQSGAHLGRQDMCAEAIAAGADVNGQGDIGWTALFAACLAGHGHIVVLLLGHLDIDVNLGAVLLIMPAPPPPSSACSSRFLGFGGSARSCARAMGMGVPRRFQTALPAALFGAWHRRRGKLTAPRRRKYVIANAAAHRPNGPFHSWSCQRRHTHAPRGPQCVRVRQSKRARLARHANSNVTAVWAGCR